MVIYQHNGSAEQR